MFIEEDLDIRSVTLSVNTLPSVSDDPDRTLHKLSALNELVDEFVNV